MGTEVSPSCSLASDQSPVKRSRFRARSAVCCKSRITASLLATDHGPREPKILRAADETQRTKRGRTRAGRLGDSLGEAILIGAGAGMGVDSGLPDFRGGSGFWKAYPPYAKLGLDFVSLANPRWFVSDPNWPGASMGTA